MKLTVSQRFDLCAAAALRIVNSYRAAAPAGFDVFNMPHLKRIYDKKEDIPAEYQSLYEEKDGRWTIESVEIEGFVPVKKLEEFRNQNVKLSESLKKFDGIDPERYQELLGRATELDDANLVTKSDVAKRVEARVKEVLEQHAKEKAQWTTQIGERDAKLRKVLIESKALEAGVPLGLRKEKGAQNALIMLVNNTFTIDENGEPVAYEPDGKTVRLSPNGDQMRGDEAVRSYVKKLSSEEAPFLFEGNTGAGAEPGTNRGGRGGADDGAANPWDPKTLNRTDQGKIFLADPARAQRMARKFGVELRMPVGQAAAK